MIRHTVWVSRHQANMITKTNAPPGQTRSVEIKEGLEHTSLTPISKALVHHWAIEWWDGRLEITSLHTQAQTKAPSMAMEALWPAPMTTCRGQIKNPSTKPVAERIQMTAMRVRPGSFTAIPYFLPTAGVHRTGNEAIARGPKRTVQSPHVEVGPEVLDLRWLPARFLGIGWLLRLYWRGDKEPLLQNPSFRQGAHNGPI